MSHWDADRQQWVEGPPQEPADRLPGDRPPAGRSHTTVLAASVAGVVLAGGLGVGVWTLVRDDGNGGGGGHPPVPVPSSVAPGGFGTPSAAASAAASAPAPVSTAPGYVRTQDPAGFRLDVPAGWLRSTSGSSVFYKPADDRGVIQVFQMTETGVDSYGALSATERDVSGNPGYQRIALMRLSGDAAQFEYAYTRDDGSARRVVIYAYTAPDRKRYALLVGGQAGDWAPYAGIFQHLVSGFCPLGYCTS
ncbi:hypothetical protein [Streptomyces morookaense]|uniref:Serine/arginine repetitive matrix protein 2 n=1 Tax=Streptomyces morookaense TaxID=1970 RepID=A0A7Y7B1A9_STRMO|nr:hypothetical protein [Streptomyces morookaense]NVK77152.1 hypothetical protein [Streptomyces morookaense]GHF17097.1 hypothetical protein GCM10010359_18300 [Streptomyces morookaense]